jgi:hypothetical protein
MVTRAPGERKGLLPILPAAHRVLTEDCRLAKEFGLLMNLSLLRQILMRLKCI